MFSHAGHAVVLLLLALCVAASFLPDERLWGINHLAFYPWPLRLVAFAIVGVCFLPPTRRVVDRLIVLAALLKGRRRFLIAGALSVAALVLFISCSSRTLLLGDGQYVVNSLQETSEVESRAFFDNLGHPDRIYPGTDWLNLVASRVAVRAFGAPPVAGVRVVNALLGALFVFLLTAASCRFGPGALDAKPLFLFLVLFSGGIELFFGYVEVYTPIALLALVYVLAAQRTLRNELTLWAPVACVAVAIFMHLLALILLPSLCFVILWVILGRRSSKALRRSCAALALATVAVPIVAMRLPGFEGFFLPVLGSNDQYGVLSPSHLVDIVNETLLVFPGFFVLLVVGVGAALDRARRRSPVPTSEVHVEDVQTTKNPHFAEICFSGFLLGSALVLLAFFKPELGMARDWDLYVIAGAGLYLPALEVLRPSRRRGSVPEEIRRIFLPVLAITVVLTSAWVGINAHPDRSVTRYRSILSYDRTNAGYAYENLASYYRDARDVGLEIDALEQAFAASGNPRHLFVAGLRHYHIGEREKAVSALQECLRRRPEDERVRSHLVQMLYFMERYDDVIVLCQEGAGRNPDAAFYYFYMGKAHLRMNRASEARAALEACRTLAVPPEIRRELDELLGLLGEAP